MKGKESIDFIKRLRDSLWNDHSAATQYEDDEHDPFGGKNAGRENTGIDWEGNECSNCQLLLEVDKYLVGNKIPSLKRKV